MLCWRTSLPALTRYAEQIFVVTIPDAMEDLECLRFWPES